MPPVWNIGGGVPETTAVGGSTENDESGGEGEFESVPENNDHSDSRQTSNPDGMELIQEGDDLESVLSCEVKDGHWICKPYKRELLAQQFDNNSPGANRRTAIIGALRDLGVKVFIIESKSIKSTKDILHHVRRVVGFVAKENRVQARTGQLGFQRCLLYQDQQGRLFNLMMAKHAVGPAAQYLNYLDTFSGMEAMVALAVLSRSLSCLMDGNQMDSLKPAYLTLVLGLVLTEELSLSWLNANMLVRASPSVSAHYLNGNFGSDIGRKVTIFALTMATAATGTAQTNLTLFGIACAIVIFLSNLGSRAWYFMHWRPLRYQGSGAGFVAYLASVATGIVVPYMGHRSITVGGKAAMEHVIKAAFVVAVCFVISGVDEVQKFLVVGSEVCDQHVVNIVIGGWWTFTLLCSLFLARKIPYKDHHPYYDGEPLLIEDHASPVGYKVPSIPDFEIDPSLSKTGLPCLSLSFELMLGVLMALGFGAGMIYLSFTSWDEDLTESVDTSWLN